MDSSMSSSSVEKLRPCSSRRLRIPTASSWATSGTDACQCDSGCLGKACSNRRHWMRLIASVSCASRSIWLHRQSPDMRRLPATASAPGRFTSAARRNVEVSASKRKIQPDRTSKSSTMRWRAPSRASRSVNDRLRVSAMLRKIPICWFGLRVTSESTPCPCSRYARDFLYFVTLVPGGVRCDEVGRARCILPPPRPAEFTGNVAEAAHAVGAGRLQPAAAFVAPGMPQAIFPYRPAAQESGCPGPTGGLHPLHKLVKRGPAAEEHPRQGYRLIKAAADGLPLRRRQSAAGELYL